MTNRTHKRSFASRPSDPDTWIRTPDARTNGTSIDPGFTARLTIDVTPALRGRIKIVAFRRGITVADMLRELLAREYPEDGETSP
jgi:hypothetical protein